VTETAEQFGPDWDDVLRRTRRHRASRWSLQVVAIGALVVVGIASAYALGHPVVDFGKARHAGLRQVNEFGSMQVAAPRGMAPGVLPHETRAITSLRIDGKVHTLYVAPTKKGGFCYEWSRLGGGCRANRHDRFASHVDPGGFGGAHGLTVLQGSFFQANGTRLTVTYADHATEDVPFTWVTAPIDAAFYLFRIPDAHRQTATRAVSLALFDEHGKLLDREAIMEPELPQMTAAHLPGFAPIMVPHGAIWSRRTLLFDERDAKGNRVYLFTMPKAGGGRCFTSNGASGCGVVANPPLSLGFSGDRLCCGVAPTIARVEARFQDGARISLYPKDGYLIWPIPADHYALGHRIVALVGYDAAGRVIAHGRVPKPADQRGIYPCKKPKSLGYGVKECV